MKGLPEALALLGMEDGEARAYQHLGTMGPTDAAHLAIGIGMTRGQAYRALSILLRRGHVAVDATEPITYRAVDPAENVEIARIAEVQRAIALASARSAFLAAVSVAVPPRAETDAPWKVRRVTGRHSLHSAARRLITKARSSVLISYASCGSKIDERARKSLLELAQRRGSQGIHVRIVTHERASAVFPRGDDAPIFFVIDGEECLFLSSERSPFGTASQGCWTSARPIVAIAEMLHGELWQTMA